MLTNSWCVYWSRLAHGIVDRLPSSISPTPKNSWGEAYQLVVHAHMMHLPSGTFHSHNFSSIMSCILSDQHALLESNLFSVLISLIDSIFSVMFVSCHHNNSSVIWSVRQFIYIYLVSNTHTRKTKILCANALHSFLQSHPTIDTVIYAAMCMLICYPVLTFQRFKKWCLVVAGTAILLMSEMDWERTTCSRREFPIEFCGNNSSHFFCLSNAFSIQKPVFGQSFRR